MAGLEAIGADALVEQRIAVALRDRLLGRGIDAVGEFLLGIEAVILRELLDDVLGQQRQFARRHHMLRVRPAGGIAEHALGQAKLARTLVHHLGETLFRAGDAFGQHDAGIVARLHDDAAQQVFHLHPAAQRHEHLRALHAPGFFADWEFVIEAELAGCKLFKDHEGGHQLRHRRRRHQFVGILLEQHRAGIVIDQDHLPRRRIDLAKLSGGRIGQRQSDGKGRRGDTLNPQ